MRRIALTALVAALAAMASLAGWAARFPDVAAFDASETLVAVGLNSAREGSTLAIYDAGTGAHVVQVALPDRTTHLFFCSSRVLMVSTVGAVLRIDPRSGAQETVMLLNRSESAAVAPACDSIAVYGPDRKDVTVMFFGSKRKVPFEAPEGTWAACYAGDESALMMLAASGALAEADLKKRKRIPLPGAGADTRGLACTGRRGVVLGGDQGALIRSAAGASQGSRIPVPCLLEFHACAVSTDGRTLASITDDGGQPAKVVRFHSTSRLKGLAAVELPAPGVSLGLSSSGASAVVTFDGADPVLVSRANGSLLRLPLPAP